MINSPVFCLTADIDWASDYCIKDFIRLVSTYNITPTFFVTHKSKIIDKFSASNEVNLGIHPNFLPDSSQGNNYLHVIKNMCEAYPKAKTFRSHSFFDNTLILREMSKRGIRYDSNICLYLQPNIVPLNLGVGGITRLPVFWEDDFHWERSSKDWNIQNYMHQFLSPGLKIFNFHPFNTALNISGYQNYSRLKKYIKTLTSDKAAGLINNGKGVRTFLLELLDYLSSRGHLFYTLDEIYRMFPINDFIDQGTGRKTFHHEDEHKKYWNMQSQEKQKFVYQSFQKRNAKDRYATSRDFNLRELEVRCLKEFISVKGPVLDLGCGNGYTLISLAKFFYGFNMTGVDFSKNLIKGAHYLLKDSKNELKSIPVFICSDAIEYIKKLASNSVKYIITERFILNLPDVDTQKQIIKEAFRVLPEGGRLLMCEGSKVGFDNLNNIREKLGLSRIAETSSDNVTALRINDEEFEDYAQKEVGFKLQGKYGFSDYFLISRALYPLMIAPADPRFDAEINKLARKIQENIPYMPGYGSNVLWVYEK